MSDHLSPEKTMCKNFTDQYLNIVTETPIKSMFTAESRPARGDGNMSDGGPVY